MASVVACATIPRALFLLFGGIVVDRLSPKRVLTRTRLFDAAVVGTLASMTWLGSPEMWMVYTIATVGGQPTDDLNAGPALPSGAKSI